jgi:hypothetical protein
MAAKTHILTAAHLRSFVALAGTEISWPNSFVRSMAQQRLDRMDITQILRTGHLVKRLAEMTNGEEMVIAGKTCDDVQLSIVLRTDSRMSRIILRSVSRI